MTLCCTIFFNDTATTEIYTLSLHDALPISGHRRPGSRAPRTRRRCAPASRPAGGIRNPGCRGCDTWSARCDRRPRGLRRSEEHTSELQLRQYLVWRLLLEKKKKETDKYNRE